MCLALNEHTDMVVEIFGGISFELRASYVPIVDSFIGLFHAIDQKLYNICSRSHVISIMDLK